MHIASPLLVIILAVLFIVLLLGLPNWPHAATLGYYPSGIVAAILLLVIVLLLVGLL
jgi:hypothetical protein